MMTLGDLIKKLEAWDDKGKVCRPALGKPHSWRGVYAELAFEPIEEATIGDMLKDAKECIGKTFEGYKGGSFRMSSDTEIHIDHYGDYSDGGAAAVLIQSMNSAIDVEGRRREWLYETAVDLILSDCR